VKERKVWKAEKVNKRKVWKAKKERESEEGKRNVWKAKKVKEREEFKQRKKRKRERKRKKGKKEKKFMFQGRARAERRDGVWCGARSRVCGGLSGRRRCSGSVVVSVHGGGRCRVGRGCVFPSSY